MSNNQNERALNWDDQIEDNGPIYTLLPEGIYHYKVVGFTRARHGGSEKLPPCNKAVLELAIDGGGKGQTTVKANLFLHSRTEGLLVRFFRSIGAPERDGKIVMNWGSVVGSGGRCRLKQTQGYKDPSKQYNEVAEFLDPSAPAIEGVNDDIAF